MLNVVNYAVLLTTIVMNPHKSTTEEITEGTMENTHKIVRLLQGEKLNESVAIEGWIRTKRDSKGGFSFLEINDGSTLRNMQVIAIQSLENYETEVAKLSTGSCVRVEGKLVPSPARGQPVEIQAEKIVIYGWASPTEYPLQKKHHSFEFLREIAHLRARTNTFAAVARLRNAMSMAIHSFFQERGFMYIQTPILTASDCEGAGEAFQVTTLDLERLSGEAPDYGQDFFGKPAYLTVSGQLEAEIYALALGNVYTFGPTFRAENSNTPRHLAEFWMVEPEMAFCDLNQDMAVAEEFLKYIFRYVLDHCEEDMQFFNRFIDDTVLDKLNHVIETPFARLTYTQAVDILQKTQRQFEYPVTWGSDLQAEHERYLTEEALKQPVIVSNYPKAIKPFYMRVNDDGNTVAAMDVLVPKIGEIIGGSQREERYEVLLERIKELGLPPENYWWYLELRKYGTAPHSGFGLGFERLIQFVTGMSNIRDVIPFPRTPKNLEF
jgi:asparaginyl-tRNA synthetase